MKKILVLLVALLISGVARADVIPMSRLLEQKKCWDAGGTWKRTKDGKRCVGADVSYYKEKCLDDGGTWKRTKDGEQCVKKETTDIAGANDVPPHPSPEQKKCWDAGGIWKISLDGTKPVSECVKKETK